MREEEIGRHMRRGRERKIDEKRWREMKRE